MKSRPLSWYLLGSEEWDWGEGVVLGFEEGVDDLPDEPEEAFRGGVLAGFELVAAEVLEVFGFKGSGELAVSDFLEQVHMSDLNCAACRLWPPPRGS